VLNNEDLNASSGNGSNSTSNNNSSSNNNSNNNKMGLHIKSEDGSSSNNMDPLGSGHVDGNMNPNNFGPMSNQQQQQQQQSGNNRPLISQNSPERIQPLPSNVVNKQSNSMDVSFNNY
jgi:hypothetical protein